MVCGSSEVLCRGFRRMGSWTASEVHRLSCGRGTCTRGGWRSPPDIRHYARKTKSDDAAQTWCPEKAVAFGTTWLPMPKCQLYFSALRSFSNCRIWCCDCWTGARISCDEWTQYDVRCNSFVGDWNGSNGGTPDRVWFGNTSRPYWNRSKMPKWQSSADNFAKRSVFLSPWRHGCRGWSSRDWHCATRHCIWWHVLCYCWCPKDRFATCAKQWSWNLQAGRDDQDCMQGAESCESPGVRLSRLWHSGLHGQSTERRGCCEGPKCRCHVEW